MVEIDWNDWDYEEFELIDNKESIIRGFHRFLIDNKLTYQYIMLFIDNNTCKLSDYLNKTKPEKYILSSFHMNNNWLSISDRWIDYYNRNY